MRKFKVSVERTDEYIIEIDENKINEDFMEVYREFFSDIYTLGEHAANIAQYRARFGERFIEGYGNVLVDGKLPFMVSEKEVEKGINIKIISEDNVNNMYVDVEEL